MKKILGIISAVVIVGSIAVWKSVDTKIIKKTDEVITGSLKITKKVSDNALEIGVKTSKEIIKSSLKVDYFDFTFIKNGVKQTLKVADFSKHSVFKTKLPSHLFVAKDELQFSNGLLSLRKKLLSNREEVLNKLRSQNSILLKRDSEILKANKKAIYEAENNMLVTTKSGNVEQQKIWLKKLRSLTKDITFIQTPKGKPIKLLNQEEILEKQIADIMKPSGGTQSRVYGYVWHHNENKGILELVAKDIHEYNRHTGGNYIWSNGVR